ncbi:hypothetical protein SZ64_00835 [Erythrobacter sp. SG61-1L]|uniref:autotransporter domain-containing protein n=1 Tax=Erythrobacter sp. SG61-1L TaxID=1603897 RepID=UPI0006C90AC9|nr:autotransporter domain-containing protein [Erythrobacter sp. SG61-1L]KPL66773.1 hypothetical protein SZ64_00835 [Erythrobacter sp. SG61-1L]
MQSEYQSTHALKPLLLAGAALACLSAFPQQASAACSPGGPGSVTVLNCGPDRIDATANSGAGSLDVTGETLEDGNINYNPHPDAEGPLGITLTVEDTSVNSTDYGGININSFVEDTTISVTLADDVDITSTEGFGGVWVRNNIGGDITIESGATVTAGTPDPNGAGITATSNGGSVSITNTGTVTDTNNRGIYADGAGTVDDFATVLIDNSGEVKGNQAGIRAVGYFADVTIENSAKVTSEQKQALVAWSQTGDVKVTNSGQLIASADAGIRGSANQGDTTVLNTGTINAYQGIFADAGYYDDEDGFGDVSVTNESDVIATGSEGIYAFARNGEIEIVNSGKVVGKTDGISVEVLTGSATIDNSGQVQGADGIRTGATTTTITNSGTITGTGSAVVVGSGATTLVLEEGSVLNGDLTIGTGSLAIDPSLDTSLSNVVAGGGTLIKQGDAKLTLTGDSSAYAGDVRVEEGLFELTGQLGSTNAFVGSDDGASAAISGEDAEWINTATFTIGQEGSGDVTVSGGARVETYQTVMGPEEGSLTLEGEGTHWFNELHAQIGREEGSSATIMVRDGAVFETSGGGLYAGEGADITITGEDSKMLIGTLHPELPADWGAADGWFSLDEGKTLVSEGGLLQADGVYIGGYGDSLAEMTVTGEDSALVSQLSLYVGGSGNGTVGYGQLTIADGASATAYTAAAGVDEGSYGTVLITGEGSSLEVLTREGYSGNMRVGFTGNATVIVQDGGLLKAANKIDIATYDTATGTLVIGAEEGEDAVAAGTVDAVNGIYFGEGDATLVFNHTSNIDFDNVMFGTGGEIRHLAGVTDLTADSPDYFGTIDVAGGLLKANGNLAGAGVAVGDGGTLGGAGTIGSLVVGDGGTLAPGNSPGQLTIVGDVLFESGSIFDVEIDGALHDSILVESGDVTIEDGVQLTADFAPGVLLDNPYQVIALGEGSTGEIVVEGDGFLLPVENNPLLEGVVTYLDDGVTVTYQGIKTPWSALVTAANQGAAANAVQALGGTNAINYAAMFLEQGDLAAVFDGLSGEIHASIKSALINESQILRSVAMDHAAESGEGTGLWATGFGNWGHTNGDANVAKLERDSAGVFVGFDTQLGDWRLGVLGGYSSSDFDVAARASTAEAETYHLGAYAGGEIGQFRLRGAFSHSWHDLSTVREVAFPAAQTLAADYDAGTTQVFGEVGYALKVGAIDLEPFAGLAYVSLKTDAYAEAGGVAALTGGSMTTDTTFGTLGLRGSAKLDVAEEGAELKVVLGWRHAFDDTAILATHSFGAAATPFTVSGVPIDDDALLAEVSLDFPMSENVRLNVGYKGQFGADATDNSVLGGLSIHF